MPKQENNSIKKTRELRGVIMSAKMKKTVVVKIDRMKTHAKYRKQYLVSKKYKAHDEKNDCNIGDTCRIMETRPLSKNKCWRLVEIIERAK